MDIRRLFPIPLVFLVVLQGYAKVIFFHEDFNQALVFYLLIACSIPYLFMSSYRKSELVMLIVAFFSYVAFGNGAPLKTLLLLFAFKSLDINKTLKIYIVINVILFCFVLFFYDKNYGEHHFTRDIGGVLVERLTLGFDNPNKPFFFFSPIIVAILILYGSIYPGMIAMLMLSISLYIYGETLSQTGFYLNITTAFILLIPFIRHKVESSKLVCYIPIFFVIISLVAIFFLPPDSFSMRIHYWKLFIFSEFDLLSLIGKRNNQTEPLDGSFIYGVVYFGVLFTAYIIARYYIFLKKNSLVFCNVLNRRYLIAIPCIYIFGFSFSETSLFEFAYNPTLFLLCLSHQWWLNEP